MAAAYYYLSSSKISHQKLVLRASLLMFLCFLAVESVGASGRRMVKSPGTEDYTRRNLLGNGLGGTPPMGYVFSCYLILRSCFVSN